MHTGKHQELHTSPIHFPSKKKKKQSLDSETWISKF